jgi:diguanylate cyclase (GGDEF)-like protein/PAS domain S-box-containing protein
MPGPPSDSGRMDISGTSSEVRDLVIVLTVALIAGGITLLLWWSRRGTRRAESAASDRSRIRFESMVERSSDLIAVLDRDGRMAYVSPSITNLMGMAAEEFIGKRWNVMGDELGPEAIRDNTNDFDQLLTSPGRSASFEYSLTDTQGTEHIYEAVATNLLDDPAMRGVILNSRDITDRAGLERELRDSKESFRTLFHDNPYPMWVFDNETLRFLQVNDAACLQYGYTRDDFERMTVLDLRQPDDRFALAHLIGHRDLDAVRPAAVYRHQTSDGSVRDVEVRAHQTIFEGHPATLVLAQDVTERGRLEAALEHRAFHDPLTELPNRALFRDRVQHALDAPPAVNCEVCLLLLDLDGFKTVNDTLGHAAGDELLDLVARRLETRLRAGDTLARMGGDEFAVLLEDAHPGDSAELAERLLAKLRGPFTVHSQEVFLTGSIGIAETMRNHGQPATRLQLLRDADLAMYFAKDSGRDRYAIFEPRMRTRTAQRLTLQTDLQHALERGQLCLYYQPIVRLATEETVGFEALVRWNHPDRGLVMPADFIPLAEETGLIVPIGRWILYEACRQIAAWRLLPGNEELGIAINVSGRQLQGPPFAGDVRDAIKLARLDPRAVTLEITESMLLTDSDSISQQVNALKELGVQLAIDDFGTGYSSLSYLTRFPLDVMKLDKSFLVGIPDATDRQALVRSIIDMGHSLHLSTLGEGIETVRELAVLRECGCDLGQGFLFAEPLPPEQATRRLASEQRSGYSASIMR